MLNPQKARVRATRPYEIYATSNKANPSPNCSVARRVPFGHMHLLRAIPNVGQYLEFPIEGADYYPWQQDLFVESPYQIENGHAQVLEKPGWDVEIQPEWVVRTNYEMSSAL